MKNNNHLEFGFIASKNSALLQVRIRLKINKR